MYGETDENHGTYDEFHPTVIKQEYKTSRSCLSVCVVLINDCLSVCLSVSMCVINF